MLFHRGAAHAVSNVAWRVVCGRQELAAAALHSAPEGPDWLLRGRWAVKQQPVSPSRWVAGWTGQQSAPNEASVNESVNGTARLVLSLLVSLVLPLICWLVCQVTVSCMPALMGWQLTVVELLCW